MESTREYQVGERVEASRDRIHFFKAKVVAKGPDEEKKLSGYRVEFDHGAQMTVEYQIANLYLRPLPK